MGLSSREAGSRGKEFSEISSGGVSLQRTQREPEDVEWIFHAVVGTGSGL